MSIVFGVVTVVVVAGLTTLAVSVCFVIAGSIRPTSDARTDEGSAP